MASINDMGGIRATLLQLARTNDEAERVRLSGILASQLEVRENDASNRTQVALWDVQEDYRTKIDRLNEQVSNTNMLIATFIEGFTPFQAEARAAWEGSARQIKKQSRDIAALKRQMRESQNDRALLHREVNEIKSLLKDRPAQRKQEHADLVDEAIRRLTAERGGDG